MKLRWKNVRRFSTKEFVLAAYTFTASEIILNNWDYKADRNIRAGWCDKKTVRNIEEGCWGRSRKQDSNKYDVHGNTLTPAGSNAGNHCVDCEATIQICDLHLSNWCSPRVLSRSLLLIAGGGPAEKCIAGWCSRDNWQEIFLTLSTRFLLRKCRKDW